MLSVRVAVLTVLLLLGGSRAAAQPVESSTTSSRDVVRGDSTEAHEFDTSFKIYPSPIWSRTAGFSAGVGFEMENLLMPGGRFLATVKPGQHLGRYTATYFAKDAFLDPLYGLVNVYFETTGHQWFYGLGPASSPDNKVAIEKQMLEAEVRLGAQPFGRRVQIQPMIKYIRHRSVRFEDWDEGAVDRLDPESVENLRFSTGEGAAPETQEGIAYGMMAGIDLRDRSVRPRRGILLQATAQRFDFSSPEGLAYDQVGIYGYGFVPLGSGTLGLRAVTQLTDQRSSVTIPFYLLPSLHGRILPGYSWDRFFGPDLFAMTLEYQLPLFNLFDVAALDWLFSFGAGNVYEDLFDQFDADLTFEDNIEHGASSYPLRPSISTGFDFFTFDRTGFDVRILLGWGTEGIRLVKFEFIHDLRDIELSKR